jgi:hypothetical protein
MMFLSVEISEIGLVAFNPEAKKGCQPFGVRYCKTDTRSLHARRCFWCGYLVQTGPDILPAITR